MSQETWPSGKNFGPFFMKENWSKFLGFVQCPIVLRTALTITQLTIATIWSSRGGRIGFKTQGWLQERCKFSGWLKVAKLCNLQMQRKLHTHRMVIQAEAICFVGLSFHSKIFTFAVFNTFLFGTSLQWPNQMLKETSNVGLKLNCFLYNFLSPNIHPNHLWAMRMKQLKMRWKNCWASYA